MRLTTLLFVALCCTTDYAVEETVWIGMSTPLHGEREGIYCARLNAATGALSRPQLAAEIKMPEFLALSPDGKRLYSACLLPNGDGGVAAFAIGADGGSLRVLNTMPTGGGQSCHVALDRTGHCLFSAQYGGGSVSAFPLAADGKILPHSALIRHSGKGPNRERQEGPHPHFVGTDAANRFLFVPDLGSDQVVIYQLDHEHCTLKPHGVGRVPPGSGPRHFVIHPNGRFAYVVNELGITVTAFRFDPVAGTLDAIQTIESLPQHDRKVPSTASELFIHPSGRFLYAATRADDTITLFQVDRDTGRLTFVEREPIRGAHPRSFNLDPAGQWLLAAGRDSNTISVFRIDQKTGRLVYNDQIVNTPQPICIVIQPIGT